MTRKKDNNAQSITIATSDLRRLVDLVKPCIDLANADTLPIISSVRLFTTDGHLHATATDRYAIIVAKGPMVAGTFEAVVELPALQRILATFKAFKKTPAEINLTIEYSDLGDPTLTASSTSINLDGLVEGSLAFPAIVPDRYPDTLKIVRKCAAAGPINRPLMASGEYLRKMPLGESGKMVGGDTPHAPVGFVAKSWVYVFMPHRPASGDIEMDLAWTKAMDRAPVVAKNSASSTVGDAR